MENVIVFASTSLENVTVNAFLTLFLPSKIIDKPEILFLRCFYLLKLISQSMKWTYDHNVIFVHDVLLRAPWLHRYGTTERGEVWSKIAENLNAMEKPSFQVTQRSVRDRYSHMKKTTRPKSHTRSEEVGFPQKNLKLIRQWKK